MEQQTTEVSEFSLAFETDSSSGDLESELVNRDSELLKGQSITMALPGTAPSGAVAEQRVAESKFEPRRVSLDQLNASVEDDVVVTQAIVTIG